MIQVAFKMQLLEGFVEEYKKRHDALWPEMIDLLHSKGMYDYSIFHDQETNILFAVYKSHVSSPTQPPPVEPILRQWWDQMADIMEVHEDNSPVMKPLRQVFHLH